MVLRAFGLWFGNSSDGYEFECYYYTFTDLVAGECGCDCCKFQYDTGRNVGVLFRDLKECAKTMAENANNRMGCLPDRFDTVSLYEETPDCPHDVYYSVTGGCTGKQLLKNIPVKMLNVDDVLAVL